MKETKFILGFYSRRGVVASFVFSLAAAIYVMSTSSVSALAVGGSLGMDFPLVHSDVTDPGISAEGFYRMDPYELRFHFSDIGLKTYSVVLGIKHFFSDALARPYIEGALGPVIVNTETKGLAYGAKPEVTAGVDLGINPNISVGVVTRYFGIMYFGSTSSGKFEANHGFSLMGNFVVWF